MKTMEKDTFKIDDTILWIGGGILLLAGIGTGVYFYLKRKKESGEIDSNNTAKPSRSGFCKYDDSYPLKHGSCGKNVMVLQKVLHSLGADIGKSGQNRDGVDGKYGNKTQAAVQKYLSKSTVSLADLNRLKRM